MKHTPGPWEIRYPTAFNRQIISSNKEICVILGTYKDYEDSEEQQPENRANAKLIASSPDLLEALIKVQKLFDQSPELNGDKLRIQIGIISVSVNDAIIKATE